MGGYEHIDSIANCPDFSTEKMNVCIVFSKIGSIGGSGARNVWPGFFTPLVGRIEQTSMAPELRSHIGTILSALCVLAG